MRDERAAIATRREEMVANQLAARGIRSASVLAAMRAVPREEFVPEHLRAYAYDDGPLSIGERQTISQPYIVAFMTEALELQPGDRVLEIGAGSGYSAAVLGELAAEVHTVERLAALAATATGNLRRTGHHNVHVHHGDGTLGWPAAAPYDAISVTAGGPSVPDSLLQQLAVGGRLVIPVGPPDEQVLVRVRRADADRTATEQLTGVRFVPLIGDEGWQLGR